MGHVERRQQFTEGQIASATKDNDVIGSREVLVLHGFHNKCKQLGKLLFEAKSMTKW